MPQFIRSLALVLVITTAVLAHLPLGAAETATDAGFTIHTLRIKDATFYDTLRNKLMWGADKRN